jgi:hypothetical protein
MCSKKLKKAIHYETLLTCIQHIAAIAIIPIANKTRLLLLSDV